MKRYNELTHEELIALSETDIERYIDIEIAYAGIAPVSFPKELKLENEGVIASEVAYEVGDILFKNQDDAIAVSGMDTYTTEYDYYSGGYDYKWLNLNTNKQVTKRMFYKQSDIVRIKEILQRNKSKRDKYEKDKKVYDKFLSETGKIRDSVYQIYNEALCFQQEVDKAKILLEKYRDLS